MIKILKRKPAEGELEKMNVRSWGIWECEVSSFDWEYDAVETCYILEGKVKVQTEDGETEIEAGDLVTFPKGLKCKWDVREAIRKHYKFE